VIRVFVVDDHALVRAGIAALVNAQEDMDCIGQAADGREALDSITGCAPDIALIDLEMPNCDGLKAIQFLRDASSDVKAIALTIHQEKFHVEAARNAGAAAFVAKHRADLDLMETIRSIATGGDFVSLVSNLPRQEPFRIPIEDLCNEELSKREREVLELLVLGYTNREISASLEIGTKSVETYRSRIAQKVGHRTRADLVRYAARTGLLQSIVREFPYGDW
jgi:DNA-binding NarL/FixJ family response regulator